MHSPFPGMDSYLEGPQWTSVHAALSAEIARQLTGKLPPRYVARPNERIVIATPEEDGISVSTTVLYPDAFVADTGGTHGGNGAAGAVVMTPAATGGNADS